MLRRVSVIMLGFALFLVIYSMLNAQILSTNELYINLFLASAFFCTNIFNLIKVNKPIMMILNTIAAISLLAALFINFFM